MQDLYAELELAMFVGLRCCMEGARPEDRRYRSFEKDLRRLPEPDRRSSTFGDPVNNCRGIGAYSERENLRGTSFSS